MFIAPFDKTNFIMADSTEFQKHKYHDYIVSSTGRDYDFSQPLDIGSYKAAIKKLQPDFDYFDKIEQYKGSTYYDTLYNNPYLVGRSNGYTPTGLEQVGDILAGLGTFGALQQPFSSGSEKRYYEELNQKSNQFLDETIDKMRQENYDSAVEQNKRLQEAGLNPDLSGGVQAGSAAENDQPIQSPSMPDQSASVLQAAEIPFTFVNGIMSLYESFQGAQAMNLQNAAQEIANNNSAMNFALDSLAESFIGNNPDKSAPELSDVSNLIDEALQADYSGYSRNTRRLIKKFYGGYKESVRNGKMPLGLDKRIAQLRNVATQNNWEAANVQSNPLYSEDFREMVTSIYGYFGDLPNLVEQLSMEASALESNYNADYYGSASGSSAALAENSANDLAKKSNVHQEALMKTMQDIDKVFSEVEGKLKDFANSGKRGSIFGLLGLLLMPTLKNQVYNGINVSFPSLHINASRKNQQFIKTDNRTYNKYK